MVHGGDKVGPRKDEALKRETRSEVQAGRATRSQEWREPEPPGEDQPEATWTLGTSPGSRPPAADADLIQLRSDLARHLDRTAFPGTRAGLLARLRDHHAPESLIGLVSALPGDVTFGDLRQVLVGLGLPVEDRQS